MPIVLAPAGAGPPAGSPTLADLERELARRTGPYAELVCGAGATTLGVPVDELRSTVEQGSLEGLWLLRRGVMAVGGAAVAGFDQRDRQRLVAAQDADTGVLTVDRDYLHAPAEGEALEVCMLEPARELRVAVRRGLDRCFVEDRITLATTGFQAERDLTSARSWLTRPSQLRGVASLAAGATWAPVPSRWWDWFVSGGHLSAAVSPDPYPDTAYLSVYRPVSSWVNGADSTTGPTADADVLAVDREYAVAAAHHYAWEAFPTRLGTMAGRGDYATKAEVAAGWKTQIRKHVRPPPDRFQLGWPYPAWEGVAG